jgi:hypothetical protein
MNNTYINQTNYNARVFPTIDAIKWKTKSTPTGTTTTSVKMTAKSSQPHQTTSHILSPPYLYTILGIVYI